MIEKLAAAEQRFEQVNERLMDPAIVGDQAQYKALMGVQIALARH